MQATSSSTIWGADLLWRYGFYRSPVARGDFLLGYQASRLNEDVIITHNFTNSGINAFGQDVFDTENEFHGGHDRVTGRFPPRTLDDRHHGQSRLGTWPSG